MNALKVCFLAGTLGRGGAERQLTYMVRVLKRAGVAVRVLCLREGEAFESEIRELGIEVRCVAGKTGRASNSRLGKLRRIVRSLKHDPADIFQSAHFYTNLYVAAAGRLVRTREIGAIRSNLYNEVRANGAMGRFHLRMPRHLIVNSEPALQRAIAAGVKPDRIDLLPNVVEMPKRDAPSVPGNGIVRILFAGRLTHVKRVDRFLRVVANVRQRLPKRRLTAVIAGDGPLLPEIEQMAERLGLQASDLELLGDCEDMSAVYRGSDLLVLTSDWEGTPNVLLEAMSHGLPVAATRVGGVPHLLGTDRGLMAEPNDEEGLATAALRLVSSVDLRHQLGQQGRDYVLLRHSLEALPQRLLTIYGKVLAA